MRTAALLLLCLGCATPALASSLDKSVVQGVIKRSFPKLRYCYERSLLGGGRLEGKLVVTFIIGPSGAVKSARIASSTLQSPQVERCVLAVFRKMKFPKLVGEVTITYPLVFKAPED